MKTKQILSLLKRLAIGGVCLSALIGVIAFLPGNIEGQYRDIGVRCMCDSVSFLQFRDGKILSYSSDHPPANIIGHYTKNADGTFDMYYDSYSQGKTDELLGHAHPHFLITKFSWSTDAKVEWGIKHPKNFTVGKTIAEHEITSIYINADKSVTKTFYDFSLQPVRSELKLPKKKTSAEQVVPPNGP